VYYASVTKRHNTLYTALKRTYFVAVINGGFYRYARAIYKREMLSVVVLEWSEITYRVGQKWHHFCTPYTPNFTKY